MGIGRILTTVALAAALAASAGCERKDDKVARPGQPPVDAAESTPADAAAPLTFSEDNEHAKVGLKLPEAIKRQPDLHARLYAEGVKDLKAFAEGAAGERAELEGQGMEIPPYMREIEWNVGADTGKLMSLWSLQSEYTGGAHGNAAYGAALWDKALKRMVSANQLFDRGADPVLDKALCDAIIAAKRERLGAEYVPPGQDWNCPKWRDTVFALAPSTQAGKAGGLVFLLPPYAVGPYAEGTYEVTVPLSAFAGEVAAAYADEFAGGPQPARAPAQP